MTTITIERALLEQAYAMLSSNKTHIRVVMSRDETCVAIRAALAAPATAPEPLKARPDFIAGYDAGMADAKRMQMAAALEYQRQLVDVQVRSAPATAPAWHVAPTVPGLWLNSVFMKVEDVEQWHIDCQLHLECARWFGPIPPDGDKP